MVEVYFGRVVGGTIVVMVSDWSIPLTNPLGALNPLSKTTDLSHRLVHSIFKSSN